MVSSAKLVANGTGYQVPDNMNFNGTDMYQVLNINDNTKIAFEDGSTYTAKDLRIMLKAMKRIVEEKYPEELV